jgi:hypothetical protein
MSEPSPAMEAAADELQQLLRFNNKDYKSQVDAFPTSCATAREHAKRELASGLSLVVSMQHSKV